MCGAYNSHNRFRMTDVKGLPFVLFTKSNGNKLRKLFSTKEVLQLHILRSAYATSWTWGVKVQPSDQTQNTISG